MTQYLLALLGISALCGGWVLLQGWLAGKDKTCRGYRAGCCACVMATAKAKPAWT